MESEMQEKDRISQNLEERITLLQPQIITGASCNTDKSGTTMDLSFQTAFADFKLERRNSEEKIEVRNVRIQQLKKPNCNAGDMGNIEEFKLLYTEFSTKPRWKAVIETENHPYGLKDAHKLTPDYLDPKYYQKMNLFEDQVATAMSIHQEYHPDLADCQPTIKFIRRIDRLIEVMMSRTPVTALRLGSGKQAVREFFFYILFIFFYFLIFIHINYLTVINEFLEYLHEWEITAMKYGYRFLTKSTCYGLNITLRATLEILEFSIYDCNYEYLMTARLNQNALERFFGLAREVCGSNDYPDSILFGQMFHLISMYSLIIPCKGSNVAGDEMISSLLHFSNIPTSETGRLEWRKIIDSIIEHSDKPDDAMNQIITNSEQRNGNARSFFFHYRIHGYIVRKARKWTRCDDCIQSLSASPSCKNYRMIALLSKGYLTEPSDELIKLIHMVEKTILDVVEKQSINSDILFYISYALQELQSELPLVGHQRELTKSVMSFYLIIRIHFLAKSYNNKNCTKKKQTHKARKDAKL
ncbi:hypothetical protein ALC57_18357 [Trachymyrmex cornetzi]|uniref:THAP domain-containing protein 9 n=1 Tax=Trachymyrmex cornetzi TaxID=471704 RepID=A0A151IS23_9HYME|nr:hypothetical protein ALC57_18357 [Trachymyrmex cornetzi]